MTQERLSAWMIKPRSFVRLLGAEYDLMKKAGGYVLLKFYVSSFVICLIAIISFLSVCYATELLFHSRIVEIALSLFLSLLFFLMYIFLINTFAKDRQETRLLNFSNVTRTAFVVFMGFVLSKPIEIWVYKEQLKAEVALVRENLVKDHSRKISQSYGQEINKHNKRIKDLEAINVNGTSNREIDSIRIFITEIEANMRRLKSISRERIGNGSFFVYRVQSVSANHPWSWGICLLVLIVFLIPGYIIYSTSRTDNYFKLRKERDDRIISISYSNFLSTYSLLFKRKYGLNVEFYSKYDDPPFNRILKKDSEFSASTKFHDKYRRL
jgi:hypothetical protein